MNGYRRDKEIFSKNGPICEINGYRNNYGITFQVNLLETELPMLNIHYQFIAIDPITKQGKW